MKRLYTNYVIPIKSLFPKEATLLRESEFQLLLLSTMFPILTTAIVSPVLDSMIEPLGATPANIGLVISFSTAPAVILMPFVGILTDRFGRKPIIVGSLLVFGLAGAAIATTTDFRVVLVLRFFQGIGFAGLIPTITTSIGDKYEGPLEETAQGLRMAVNGISGTFFPLIAGTLVVITWYLPFLLYAFAIPTAMVVYWWVDEPTDDNSEDADGELPNQYWRAFADLLSQKRVVAIVVARALPMVIWITFLTYNSLIVVHLLDGTAFHAGFLMASGNLVFGIAGSQADRTTTLLGSRYVAALIGNTLLAVGFIFVLFAPGVGPAVVGIIVAGIGFGTTLTLYRSIITGLAPQKLRGGLVSLSAAGSQVSATVTPVLFGVILAATEPMMSLSSSIQLAGTATAIVGGMGGIVCLLIANLRSVENL